jgi:AcrR family transcriptional regulator
MPISKQSTSDTPVSPSEGLSQQEVIRAALRVIKKQGVAGLTMRKLATELDVSPMAAYYHLPAKSKNALLELVIDNRLARVRLPNSAEGTWDERLCIISDAMRRELEGYPGLATVAIGILPKNGRRIMDAVIDVLREAGFRDETVLQACLALHALAYGCEAINENLRVKQRTKALKGPLAELARRLDHDNHRLVGENTFPVARGLIIEGLKAELASGRRASKRR